MHTKKKQEKNKHREGGQITQNKAIDKWPYISNSNKRKQTKYSS